MKILLFAVMCTIVVGVAGCQNLGASSFGAPVRATQYQVFQQDKVGDYISPFDNGVKGDGVTDDTAGWLATIAKAKSQNKAISGFRGRFKCNQELDFSGVKAVRGGGASSTIFDFSSAKGPFPDNATIFAKGAGLIALPTLASDANAGSSFVTLTSTAALRKGDVVVIFNPAPSSYSRWRSYYHAGEYAEVLSVSGNRIHLTHGLYATYSKNDVSIYKMNKSSFDFEGFSVVANTALNNKILSGIDVELMTSGLFRDVSSSGAYNSAVKITQSYNINGEGIKAYQTIYNNLGVGYGVAVANSQNVFFEGGEYVGSFNGITLGGGESVGAVVNRNVNFTDIQYAAQAYDPQVKHLGYAANHHGNVEYSKFSGNFFGPISMSGNNNTYEADKLVLPAVYSVGGAISSGELSGINHRVTGKIIAYGSSNVRGVIDIGGGFADFSDKSKTGGTFNCDGVEITAPDWHGPVITVINRGYTGDWSVSAVGAKINMPNAVEFLRTVSPNSSGAKVQGVNQKGSGLIRQTSQVGTVKSVALVNGMWREVDR